MRADSYIVPQCTVLPGSFGALMALYEANYLKLDALIPGICGLRGSYLSSARRDCDAYLTVEERSRYTAQLFLTYRIDDDSGSMCTPGLTLRVYSDARVAEVLCWHDIERHAVLRRLGASGNREIDRRWTANMLLSKWLDYLVDMGHVFAKASVSQMPVERSMSGRVFA
jgi:uncharacterized protein YqiB (DUF1249 family)